jgi:antitoxin VapB
MALNIKNQDVENLLNSVVKMTGESKTEAVRKALEERQQRLALRFMVTQDDNWLNTFLGEEIWPQIPPDQLGTRLSKEEEEAILGMGDLGV